MENETILKAPEQKEYPITNFNLETGDGEILRLQNVSVLDLGMIYGPPSFSEAERKIRIFSHRGSMEFALSEIKSISFTINNEEDRIFIDTILLVPKKETKDGKEDD